MSRYVRVLYVMLCMMVLTSPAGAGDYLPVPWIRVLSESGDWLCAVWVREGVPVEVYVWVKPDPAGITCVEYRVVLNAWYEPPMPPYNITLISSPPNPSALFVVGNPVDSVGTVICFPECQEDLFWAHKLVFLPASHGALVYLDIAPHGQSGEVRAVSCTEPGNLYVNLYHYEWDWTAGSGGTCPGIEESSWGAIKLLYRQDQ